MYNIINKLIRKSVLSLLIWMLKIVFKIIIWDKFLTLFMHLENYYEKGVFIRTLVFYKRFLSKSAFVMLDRIVSGASNAPNFVEGFYC